MTPRQPLSSLATSLLALVFAAGAVATWAAGVTLSKTTDALDSRLGLGEELGGSILALAVFGLGIAGLFVVPP
jgi:hypothetical protein